MLIQKLCFAQHTFWFLNEFTLNEKFRHFKSKLPRLAPDEEGRDGVEGTAGGCFGRGRSAGIGGIEVYSEVFRRKNEVMSPPRPDPFYLT